MILQLKQELSIRLSSELPGKVAHEEAAPYRKVDFQKFDLADARKSGVLIMLYSKQDEPHLTLIQRPVYDGTHSGQIAFPGGKQEDSDRDIIHTALREANEEVGITMEDVEVLGQLSDVYIPVSNFLVSPVVGVLHYEPAFVPDQREVEEVIELRLAELTEVQELILKPIQLSNGLRMEVPTFDFHEKTIWGATALMLNELRYILRAI